MKKAIVILVLLGGLLFPSPASAETCSIPSGPNRVVTSWGCGVVGYFGGAYVGNVQDLVSDGFCTKMQRKSGSTWYTLRTDCNNDGASVPFNVTAAYGTVRMTSGSNSVIMPVAT
jgi:hypothetical protein